ncbi:response regulator transcription factor [Subsaximicrobium wynnwilliamsii]|uniref:Response regulator transcription factor n=1 Tax=Subsaximicrobium wynnwilliamsii TaxID=291179 RepID=A0A5C6ZD74_9FLAO|nr:response regulator transcription factor [Subsaximicrobium wynnwilliamsii]TXD81797.1 response regulator transcription factor [Subsaximicrobium wynnwilliamsii]TXD87623.1 response regulator transcription factor [Subsaximicrobium wynnwilliamsii]TXE01296.1 response regulator transcription factor [Subsaximicrobium wynnwilliamsii]
MKILIIEDEPQMLENMRETLEKEHYTVESASDFKAGLNKIGAYDYDCILLDIGLPDGNGLELLIELKRQDKADGVIIVSAKNSLDDRIEGLNLGADDYLSKPFHMAELHARVKAVIRRRNFEGSNFIEIGNVIIDPESRSVSIEGQTINLNRKEYDILTYLVSNKTRLVTKTALAEHVWGDYIDQADSFDFIYSQIKNLRKKLEKASISIEAVYGVGYKLDLNA